MAGISQATAAAGSEAGDTHAGGGATEGVCRRKRRRLETDTQGASSGDEATAPTGAATAATAWGTAAARNERRGYEAAVAAAGAEAVALALLKRRVVARAMASIRRTVHSRKGKPLGC